MIIWRGWGILALLLLGGGYSVMRSVVASMDGQDAGRIGGAFGMLVGAAACWFLGQYLNVTRPKQRVETYSQQRRMALHQAADQGVFHMGPGHAAPRSLAEAHMQADQLADAETAQMAGTGRNRNTLFFVPMQYVGVVGGAIGLFMLVAALVGGR